MQMKGYTYQQETQRMVGIAAMENQSNGGMVGNVSSMVGDVVGLGVSLGGVGSVVNMTKDVLTPMANMGQEIVNQPKATGWNCSCGMTNIQTNFCPECGNKKPAPANSWDCGCGQKGVTTNFCPNCGAKRPNPTWNCNCGQTDISTNFCPNCGAKRGA